MANGIAWKTVVAVFYFHIKSKGKTVFHFTLYLIFVFYMFVIYSFMWKCTGHCRRADPRRHCGHRSVIVISGVAK